MCHSSRSGSGRVPFGPAVVVVEGLNEGAEGWRFLGEEC